MNTDVVLRPATAADEEQVKKLIREKRLNPFRLNWPNFTVAVDGTGRFVGCVQRKPHGPHVNELASLAVVDGWQGQGVGRMLINHIIATTPPPIWLMCRSELVPFYERFGFVECHQPAMMPSHFRRAKRISAVIRFFVRRPTYLAVMEHA